MTQENERPRIDSFVRPGTKRSTLAPKEGYAPKTGVEKDAKDYPPTAIKSAEEDVDPKFIPKTTPEEFEAEQKMKLYGSVMDQLEPVVDYQAYLKEMGISEDEAADMVDDLITRGYYEERISVTKRSTVVFRSRSQADTLRLQRAVEVQRPLFRDAMDELIVRYNMAASLVSFKDKDFDFPQEDDPSDKVEDLFDVRLNYIERMPGALFTALSMKLAKFDRKLMAVMREGVAENF